EGAVVQGQVGIRSLFYDSAFSVGSRVGSARAGRGALCREDREPAARVPYRITWNPRRGFPTGGSSTGGSCSSTPGGAQFCLSTRLSVEHDCLMLCALFPLLIAGFT